MEQKMNKSVVSFIFCLATMFLMTETGVAASNRSEDIRPPQADEVFIAPTGIMIPLERILLVRKESVYCAIKFIKFWEDKVKSDSYASYESYFQNDKSGNFMKENVKYRKEELLFPKAGWSLFGHPVAFNAKEEIKCGSFRLRWTGKGTVHFFAPFQKQGDYGIELAPTKWTNITQVDAFDQRLKWYKFDENRQMIYISVDRLWDDEKK